MGHIWGTFVWHLTLILPYIDCLCSLANPTFWWLIPYSFILFRAGWVEWVILKQCDYSVSPKSLFFFFFFFFFLQGQLDLGVYWDRGMDLGLTTLLTPMCEKSCFKTLWQFKFHVLYWNPDYNQWTLTSCDWNVQSEEELKTSY